MIFPRPTSSVGYCASAPGAPPAGVFQGVLLLINICALIYGNREAFKARHVNMDYRENVHIGYVLACILQTILIFCPLLLVSKAGEEMHFVFRTIAVVMTSAWALYLIFVPKISFYYQDRREEAKQDQARLLAVIMEDEENEGRGVRIRSVSSMVDVVVENNNKRSVVEEEGQLRITRRQFNPTTTTRRNQDAEDPKPKPKKKKYVRPVDVIAPSRTDMSNFAMAL